MNKQGEWRPRISKDRCSISREEDFFAVVCRNKEEADSVERSIIKALVDSRSPVVDLPEGEIDRFFSIVDELAEDMKARFEEKFQVGRRGWEDPESRRFLLNSLLEHFECLDSGDFTAVTDLAILAVMVSHMDRRLSTAGSA